MQPLGNRVLIRPVEEKQESKGGIILPSTALNPVKTGEVIAVGRGAATMSGDLIPMEVQEGDMVIFPDNNGGILIKEDGEDLILLHETDLCCIR